MKIKLCYLTVFFALLLASCHKDLNREPITSETTLTVFSNPASIKEAFAKLYAGLSLSGQGITTNPDIAAGDVGSNTYLRNYWNAQELPTDEAVIAWNDADLQQFHLMNWTPNNSFIRMLYYRVYLEISLCNEFLRQTASGTLNTSGFSDADVNAIQTYRTEARFLRALSYWHALDLFGNIPFVTEADPIGNFQPPQISRDSAFRFVETELMNIQQSLPAPKQNEYGRADQGAAWMLLAKLYLNAEVYTGTPRYADAITYCNRIISSGAYTLATNYAQLFQIDNDKTGEIILPIRANGLSSQSYGNTTYLVHASIGGSMDPKVLGVNGAWGGLRVTQNIPNIFDQSSGDKRAMFYTAGQTRQVTSITNFTNGYAVTKFKNVTSTGEAGSDPSGTFVDTDFPMFRLGDVYLMYAEAVLRGGTGGDPATALSYVNALRTRAFGNSSGNINASGLTLDFIFGERTRELYWEAHRRTDLIRFGRFTSGSYLWDWKGGVLQGAGVDPRYNLYPIPTSDLVANPKMKQNPGY